MMPLRYIVRSLGRRKLRTIMTVVGVALVVGIYASMSAVATTMVRSFRSTGTPEEVVVVQAGSLSLDFSRVSRSSFGFIRTLDGVAGRDESPLVSPELALGTVAVVKGRPQDLSLRGVTENARQVYSQVRLFDGRWPTPNREALLGRTAAAKLGVTLGDSLTFEGEQWTIVGLLDAGGRVYDQEVWVELEDLAAAAQRQTYSSYVIRAESTAAAAALVETINENRSHPLQAQLAPDFYARTGGMSIMMAMMGQFIAMIIAIGAAFGGMNTMYSAVASRRREIGILRALGFSRSAVLLAFLIESLALCFIGGLLGVLLGLLLSFIPIDVPFLPASRVVLGLPHIAWSMVLAIIVGVLGGGLPALQAARLKLVDALR